MFNHSMNFALGEEIEALRRLTQSWAQKTVKSIASKIDLSNKFPSHLWKEMGDLGLLGITVMEEFGGVNMGYLAHTVAVESPSERPHALQAAHRNCMQ